jgi:hypothetical protein
MIPVIQKKVILPEPALGFRILRAAQLAIRIDRTAEFRTQPSDDGFVARKVYSKNGIELRVEATGDKPIDTRVDYSDFVVSGFLAYSRDAIDHQKKVEIVETKADSFANQILQAIEVQRWVQIPALEYETCCWCPDKVPLTWNDDGLAWDCPNHGYISSDMIVLEMIRPFLP